MSKRRKNTKPAKPVTPAVPAPAAPADHMVQAWAILAVALVLILGLEAFGFRAPGWRPTQFLAPAPPVASSPAQEAWPTPVALPPLAGSIHTRPRDIARLFSAHAVRAKTPLRIAYFADSIIEGDLITQDLRQHLQARFGGSGVGWVGIAPLDAWARDDIQESSDLSWVRHSILKSGWNDQAFGPQGSAWTLNGGRGGVRFKGVWPQLAYRFLAPATLWYGPVAATETASVTVTVDGADRKIALSGTGPLNSISLTQAPCPTLSLDFDAPADVAFFAVSFDTGSGVDCFSTRGSQGGPLVRLSLPFLQALQAQRGYGLIIAQFGINAIGDNADPAFKWYRRSLGAGLQRLQQGLSPTPMVLVSVTDVGIRKDGEWISDPHLPGLLEAQRAAAADLGIPFINGFDLMGGRGSAAQWALTTPPLIEPDREHLTPQGAKRFEAALWPALQSGGKNARRAKP